MKTETKKYKTILADPPWSETGGGKIRRGADRHYPLMKTSEILTMAPFVRSLADENCHLYLWVTNNFLKDGLKVMEHWGFTYKTKITWMKDRFGLGQYFRGITEDCLFGVKGCLPYKTVNGKRQQGVTGFLAPRGKHSEKPEEMRKMIEKVSYPPYIELFARKRTPGWDAWGNEVCENPLPNAEPGKGNVVPRYRVCNVCGKSMGILANGKIWKCDCGDAI